MKNNNDDAVNSALKKANINIDELKKATQNGSAEDYLSKKLPKDAGEKLKRILNDKQATEKILSSPEAKKLLEKFGKK